LTDEKLNHSDTMYVFFSSKPSHMLEAIHKNITSCCSAHTPYGSTNKQIRGCYNLGQ